MRYYWMIYDGNGGMDYNHIGAQKILNNTMPDYSVCCGEYVENWNPDITFVCSDKTETVVPDWISCEEDWITVSQRFVDIVKPFENGAIQYLPIKVDAIQPQMRGEKYFVANVIKVLDAIDYEKSKTSKVCGARVLIKCVIKEDKIKGNHIFNLKQDCLCDTTIVSEDFKNAIKKAKLLGFDFAEVKVV